MGQIHREEAAVLLASAFISQYKKYDFRFPSINKIQETKWWIHFLRAADHRHLEDWNPDIWVKCQFEKNGKVLPFQLYGKKAEESFNELKFKYIEGKKDRRAQLVSSVLATYKTIKLWCNKNNDGIMDFDNYILSNKIKIDRNELSEYFLSVCKPYIDKLIETNDVEKINKLKNRRLVIYSFKELKEKLQLVMGDDFY